ncbi:glycosyltransferase [Sphingobacterium griseoflavum]|uniref:Glycosyltransferase subfamily 4-like N-terminal domain-containing protein n=1 Tax=Sphingobacterium griseoflavum TaxID=1474952 RepID=A0ABQ3HYN5_9SPHI|nr:glycosyltransferase [Sphingobacterium griseoflavum]GHE38932.1 hypothetical protein GCM10017764_22630 [Sphingobacterium griseoflavum]
MKKKQILIALPNDVLGGAEQVLKMIAKYWLEQHACVHIFFLKKRSTGAWESLDGDLNLHYTNAASEKKGLIQFFWNLRKFKSITFDYTFTSHVHLNGFFGLLRKCNVVRTEFFVARESTSIFERYSGLKKAYFSAYYYMGYSAIDLLICQTEGMKCSLVEALPFIEKKVDVKVIHNPVDLKAIQSAEQSNDLVQSFGKYFVAAGRLIPEKGFDLLIRAFAEIKTIDRNYKLVILGDGPLKGRLEDLISEYRLSDSVVLAGFVKNVFPFFRGAELCIVSSRIEGFPNVLLQMMSQNKKVISTNCAHGIEDIPGLFMAEKENVTSLTNAISLALKTDGTNNRMIFDEELKLRSIDSFINSVLNYVNKKQ